MITPAFVMVTATTMCNMADFSMKDKYCITVY